MPKRRANAPSPRSRNWLAPRKRRNPPPCITRVSRSDQELEQLRKSAASCEIEIAHLARFVAGNAARQRRAALWRVTIKPVESNALVEQEHIRAIWQRFVAG